MQLCTIRCGWRTGEANKLTGKTAFAASMIGCFED
jgi:hypothetical protein